VNVKIVVRVNIKPRLRLLEPVVLHALVAVLVKNKQHNVQRLQIIVYVEIVMQVNIKPLLHLLEPVVLRALVALLAKNLFRSVIMIIQTTV